MVESYMKVMQPPPGLIEESVKEASDPTIKWKTLEEAQNRAEWERGRRKREDADAKEKEEEAKAFAAIDWQDFVVVETIEFTQNDMELELPPPTSVDRLKSMSMAEKRMASMVMEETGAGPTGGEVDAPPGGAAQDEMEMEEEEEEETRLQRIKAEQEQARARDVQRAAMEQRGMKIRKDYVSKGESSIFTVQLSKRSSPLAPRQILSMLLFQQFHFITHHLVFLAFPSPQSPLSPSTPVLSYRTVSSRAFLASTPRHKPCLIPWNKS